MLSIAETLAIANSVRTAALADAPLPPSRRAMTGPTAPILASGPVGIMSMVLSEVDPGMHKLYMEGIRHLQMALAPATREQYMKEWARFCKWCAEQPNPLIPLPATDLTVFVYLSFRSKLAATDQAASVSTVTMAHAAIKHIHRANQVPSNPADSMIVQDLVQATRTTLAATQQQAKPLTKEDVEKIAAMYAVPSSTDAQFSIAAMTTLSFHGLARFGDWQDVQLRHVTVFPDHIDIFVPARKNDQEYRGHRITVLPSATGLNPMSITLQLLKRVKAADDKAKRTNVLALPLFRTFYGHHFTRGSGDPPLLAGRLEYKQFLQFLRVEAMAALGISLQEANRYSAHSSRRGGASHMADRGATMMDIKMVGGWKSDAAPQLYVDQSEASRKARAALTLL